MGTGMYEYKSNKRIAQRVYLLKTPRCPGSLLPVGVFDENTRYFRFKLTLTPVILLYCEITIEIED
jgi:hypothetical protein